MAIIDASGMIVAVNDAWKESGRLNGLSLPNDGIGANHPQYCASTDLVSQLFTILYPCHSPNEQRSWVKAKPTKRLPRHSFAPPHHKAAHVGTFEAIEAE
jgi:hypothetical protein